MEDSDLDRIRYTLTAGGHLPCPADPVQAAHWGGWSLDIGTDGEALVTHTIGVLGPYDEAIANDMAMVAYARLLARAGYRVTPVTYPADRKYLNHYLEVRIR